MQNTVIVDGDLEVVVDALYQTYAVRMLEGLPIKQFNDAAITRALEEAKNMGFGQEVYLIEPPITPIPYDGEYHFGIPERLPYIKCIANLHYFTAIRDPSKHGADLMVVWFQDDFAFPIQADILDKFKEIPFRQICYEYYH